MASSTRAGSVSGGNIVPVAHAPGCGGSLAVPYSGNVVNGWGNLGLAAELPIRPCMLCWALRMRSRAARTY